MMSRLVLLLSAWLPLAIHASMLLSVDPSERMEKVQRMIDRIKSDNPSPDMYDEKEDYHDTMVQQRQQQRQQQQQDTAPRFPVDYMKKQIEAIKASIPPVHDDDDEGESGWRHGASPHNTTTSSHGAPSKKQQHPSSNDMFASRLAKMKRAVKGLQEVDLRSEDAEEEDIGNNPLRLTLTKPLGFILDADQENAAIVFALDEEYPGAAQELSPKVQEQLVGRRIVSVNQEDVTHLNLMEIAETIISSDDPVLLEFEETAKDDDEHVLRLSMNKPLGFILDADTQDEAIVISLDEEFPGTAQTLSTKIQEQLVGRRIVKVNNEDVSMLNVMQVAERIVASDNPVALEFERIEDEDSKYDEEDPPKKIDYYANHLSKSVAPGELSVLKWNDNHDIIDPYAAQIGLPEQLVPTIQAYAKRLQIMERIKDVLYKHPCEPSSGRIYETQNPHVQSNDELTFQNSTNKLSWYAQRPGSHWNSDMHWFGCADERTHESMLHMLFKGDFEQVLNAIGTHYGLDGLFIQSVGFLGVTNCEEGFLHHDFQHVHDRFFNLLIPVLSPADAGPELNVAGKRIVQGKNAMNASIVGTKVKYNPEFGVLVGDGTLHGTRECDHRPQGEIRVVLSVYLVDLTEGNADKVSSDDTAIFPVPKVKEWLWAQQGRHWQKDMCMMSDVGRRPFEAVDQSDRCVEVARQGKCESKPNLARKLCPKSCNVYMDDHEYRPGVKRSVVMRDFDFVG